MSTNRQGKVFMLVGPSGVGKNTLLERVLRGAEELFKKPFGVSVSWTTRDVKSGEVPGQHYHFATREDFMAYADADGFAEWAEVHGNFYGTPKAELARLRDAGQDVIFDLDIQGALQLKEQHPEFVLIFVVPPSMAELRRRIIERNRGDSVENIQIRLDNAIGELHQVDKADYIIQNGDLAQATSFLLNLVMELSRDEMPSMTRFRNPTLIQQCLRARWEEVAMV